MNVTKEEFLAYEKIRASGKTNMIHVSEVVRLSEGVLSFNKASKILNDYKELLSKYCD